MPGKRWLDRRRAGFTIVEVIVVVGILSLLIGLLLPALGGVRRRMHKATETSNLRQIGQGWAMYANQSGDHVLPGFLHTQAQKDWRVKYRFQNDHLVPPGPDYAGANDDWDEDNLAGPWAWRLMSYLGHATDLVTFHRDNPEALSAEDRAAEIAFEPAFAYNGLFVGGWWDSGQSYKYAKAEVLESDRRVLPVSRSLPGIRRSSELIIFGTAAARGSGVYKYNGDRDDEDGTWIMSPPIYTRYDLWGVPKIRELDVDGPSAGGTTMTAQLGGDPFSIEYYGNDDWFDNPVPAG